MWTFEHFPVTSIVLILCITTLDGQRRQYHYQEHHQDQVIPHQIETANDQDQESQNQFGKFEKGDQNQYNSKQGYIKNKNSFPKFKFQFDNDDDSFDDCSKNKNLNENNQKSDETATEPADYHLPHSHLPKPPTGQSRSQKSYLPSSVGHPQANRHSISHHTVNQPLNHQQVIYHQVNQQVEIDQQDISQQQDYGHHPTGINSHQIKYEPENPPPEPEQNQQDPNQHQTQTQYQNQYDSGSSRQPIQTPNAPSPIGPFSQAIRSGQTVYISGQVGIDPRTSKLQSTFESQAEQTFANLQAIAAASGGTLDDIVKLTVFLTDFKYYATLNEVQTKFFREPYPARSTVAVKQLARPAILIEIDAVMVLPAK